jgi:Carboxypeptidase regulatory-like domain/TonB dependent receptor
MTSAIRTTRARWVQFLLLMAVVAATVSLGRAQTVTGSVRGTITDPTGAVIANATVTVTNLNTGIKSITKTNVDGLYSVDFLPIGRYVVTVTSSGFAEETSSPFQLEIDQQATINVPMRVNTASTQVTVSFDVAPILNTESPTLGVTVSGNTIASMPLNGRDLTAATVAIPGSIHSGGQMNEEPGVNGNRQEDNSFLLDGFDIYNQMNGVGFNNTSGAAYLPNPDALEEIRVITSNANAEFSNANGGTVIAVMKSGTNSLHGSAFEQIENYNMNANTWDNKHTSGVPAAVTPYTQSYFGGEVGGPILKDKLFYFLDYQGYRYHSSGGTASTSVIPAAWRRGDFSDLLTQAGIQLHDANGNAFQDNQLPINNPVAQFLFAHPEAYPLPNAEPTDVSYGDQNNYQGPSSNFNTTNQGDAKIDWKIRDKDQLSGRFTTMGNENGTSFVAVPATFPFSNGTVGYTSVVLNEVHVFSNNATNELRVGFGRNSFGSGEPTDPSGLFGLTGNQKVGLTLPQATYMGFTQQKFSGSPTSSVGDGGTGQYFALNNFAYGDDFTWQHGRHLIKMGAQFIRYQQNFYYGGSAGALGTMTYSGNYSGDGGYAAVADFVLGYVTELESDSNAAQTTAPGLFGQRSWRDGFFIQDDYKLRPNLTLNLGIRYDYTQPLYEVHNRETNINLQTGAFEYAGQNGNSRALYNATFDQVAPRVGFAYSISPRVVLRGGYGITTYFEGMGVGLRLTQNPPWQQVYTLLGVAPSGGANGQPLPVTTGLPSASSGSYTGCNTYSLWDPNIRPSLTQSYSLTTEYQLNDHSSVQVGYVGNDTHNLTIPVWANQWPASCAGAATCAAAPFADNPQLGATAAIKETATTAMSNYNALQAVYRWRSSHGLDFTANYTWSKAMTNGSQGFNGIFGTNGIYYQQNAFDLAAEYGPSPLDATHNISSVVVYELPFGQGRQFGANMNRAADLLLGGWKLSGLVSYFTGNPLTITSPNNYGGQLHDVGSDRANHLNTLNISNRSINHWFGTGASATPCFSQPNGAITGNANTCAYSTESYSGFGTASNGSERGPGFQNVDLSLFKTFRIIESQSLQFRADAFNSFNLASYGNPDTGVADSGFGVINSSRLNNPRTMQLTLSYHF